MSLLESGLSNTVLNLRAASPTHSCALEPLLQRILQVITGLAKGVASVETNAARERLEQLCAILHDHRDRETALALGDEIVAICTQLLESASPLKSAARELAAAVALVREAISSMSVEERELGQSLVETAGRFDALRLVPDLNQLRAGLAREVAALRDVAAAREAQWKRRAKHVERKIAVLEDQLAETQVEAMHDAVTGLVNRRTAEKSFAALQTARRPFVLGLMDLDDFKSINDTLGHLSGDEALRRVAAALQVAFRTTDVVGRFGGDEFIVIMVDTALMQAEHRFRTLIRDLPTVTFGDGEERQLRMTCGVAEFSAGDTFEGLVKRADQALYEAKRAGKNRVVSKAAPFIRDLKRGGR